MAKELTWEGELAFNMTQCMSGHASQDDPGQAVLGWIQTGFGELRLHGIHLFLMFLRSKLFLERGEPADICKNHAISPALVKTRTQQDVRPRSYWQLLVGIRGESLHIIEVACSHAGEGSSSALTRLSAEASQDD